MIDSKDNRTHPVAATAGIVDFLTWYSNKHESVCVKLSLHCSLETSTKM